MRFLTTELLGFEGVCVGFGGLRLDCLGVVGGWGFGFGVVAVGLLDGLGAGTAPGVEGVVVGG